MSSVHRQIMWDRQAEVVVVELMLRREWVELERMERRRWELRLST